MLELCLPVLGQACPKSSCLKLDSSLIKSAQMAQNPRDTSAAVFVKAVCLEEWPGIIHRCPTHTLQEGGETAESDSCQEQPV